MSNTPSEIDSPQSMESSGITVIKSALSDSPKSNVKDPFGDMYSDGQLIDPGIGISFDTMAGITLVSGTVLACIQAIKLNGFQRPIVWRKDAGVDDGPEVEAESKQLASRIKYLNFKESLQTLRGKVGHDLLTMGSGYLELVPSVDGYIVGAHHLPAKDVRMTKLSEPKKVTVMKWSPEDGEEEVIFYNRFRRFCQDVNGKKIWFNEIGCPEAVNAETGEYVDEDWAKQNPLKVATCVMPMFEYSSLTPYGVPLWVSCLPDIQTRMMISKVNRGLLKNANVPSTILGVPKKDYDFIRNQLKACKDNNEMVNFIVYQLIEPPAPLIENLGKPSAPSLPIDKVTLNEPIKEGFFNAMRTATEEDILEAFRMPPTEVGRATEYNYASATIGRQMAIDTVYRPYATMFDDIFNKTVTPWLLEGGVKYHHCETLIAPIDDRSRFSSMLQVMIQGGAATPNMLLDVCGRFMGIEFEKRTEPWADEPFQLVQLYRQAADAVAQKTGNEALSKAAPEEIVKAAPVLGLLFEELDRMSREAA